ncbi:cation:proton antiporter domain-containing protein [Natrialbaceae archaeon A-gly3]
MVVFLTAPLLLQRYRLPGIVGIILVGAAVGPGGLGLLEADHDAITLLGEVGLVYLMFIAGLEINLNRFVEYRERSVVFGLLSFLIPQGVATAAGVYVLGLSLPAALLFAAILSSHTLLAYPVVNHLGIRDEEAITVAVGGTILTDTLALLVLAVVIASVGEGLEAAFWLELAAGLTIFFLGVWLAVPRLGRWFFRTHHEESYFEFLFVMAVLFASAFLAELAGVEPIIGAFLAGLALNRLISETGPLMNRIEFVGNALFIPFFLLSVGLLVEVSVLLEGPETLVVATSMIVLVVTTKLFAAWLTGRVYDYDRPEILGMFGLSVGQAAAALAIVLIGFETGVPGFDRHMINGVVLMILVVSLLSPALVTRAGTALAREGDLEAYDPTDTPQRILLPISREPEYRESLLDLALALRGDRSEEPLHVLSVVRPATDSRETDARVAHAEEVLERMETYAAGAEVPIEDHTRINHNVATGIVNSSVENRISTIVIGWDGTQSREQHVHGHVIDQVLSRSPLLTLVGRIRRPINAARRLVVVLPPGIEHNPGFLEAVHTVKRLAEGTGTSIIALAIGASPADLERAISPVDPEVPAEFETVENWTALRSVLEGDVAEDDNVVCLSARRGDPGWQPALRTLPTEISRLTDGNFAIVYPATEERDDERQFLRFE